MHHKPSCWAIVMDSMHARLFVGPRHRLIEVATMEPQHPSPQEHYHDRPGRSFESATNARHAYDPHEEWLVHQQELFARDIARYMAKIYNDQGFDILYVISPSKMLGIMRCYFAAYLLHLPGYRDVEVHYIDKDITHYNDQEIQCFIDAT